MYIPEINIYQKKNTRPRHKRDVIKYCTFFYFLKKIPRNKKYFVWVRWYLKKKKNDEVKKNCMVKYYDGEEEEDDHDDDGVYIWNGIEQ